MINVNVNSLTIITKEGLSRQVEAFKRGIEKAAQMLSRKGVRVVFRGTQACTDGKVIHLPDISMLVRKNMDREQVQKAAAFLGALRGYLDHELGHVDDSNFNVVRNAAMESPKLSRLLNIIEDGRVERKFASMWKGSGFNLDNVNEWSFRKSEEQLDQIDPIGHALLGLLILSKFDKTHWLYKKLPKEARDFLAAPQAQKAVKMGRAATSTADSLAAAREFLKALQDAGKDVPQEQSDDGDGEGQDGEAGEKGEGKGKSKKQKKQDKEKGKEKGESKEKGSSEDDGDEGEDDEEEDGNGSGGDDEGDEEGDEEEGEGGGEDDEDEGESSSSEDGEKGDQEKGNTHHAVEDGKKGKSYAERIAEGANDDDAINKAADAASLDKQLEEEFKKAASQGEMADLLRHPYTTELDRNEIVQKGSAEEYKEVIDAVGQGVLGALKRQVSSLLRARAAVSEIHDLEEGDLDKRRLHKLATGRSARVFKETTSRLDPKGSAVVLCVNESGSMSDKVMLAVRTCVAFAEVLESAGIAFAVIGHTTINGGMQYQKATEGGTKREQAQGYTRFGGTWFRTYKTFGEKWAAVHNRITKIADIANTYDSEAVLWAASMFLDPTVREAKRKIVFMIDDGEPCPACPTGQIAESLLIRAVGEVTKTGIEVIGIGIMSDTSPYYPKSITVDEIERLPMVVLTQMRDLLLHRVRVRR